ncbi:MAG: nicotinamide-nucleotide adenylyltransferase [Candidatus Nitrosothermus koennekii]|nr:MAG: nicotinamide-nucleotide adenylyltransferase [Candidatus Nitrosothermus koennekii]
MEGLLVGRFQPFHLGHLEAVKHALSKVDMLWIVIGSAQKSHEPRNPFTAGERLSMIKATLDASNISNWYAIPAFDANYHYIWTRSINMLVPNYDIVFTNDPLTELLFKEEGKEVMEVELKDRSILSGTEIRKRIANNEEWKHLVSKEAASIIEKIDGINRIKLLYR